MWSREKVLGWVTDAVSSATNSSVDRPLPSRDELLALFNITDEEISYLYKLYNASSPAGSGPDVDAESRAECYCGGWARDMADAYRRAHGYVSLAVCLFGTVANLLNVAVLTRKDMRKAPINRLLTWLAVADVLVMVEYVPFACYAYLVLPERVDFPYGWAVFVLFHGHFSQVMHTISICLTQALAVWKYIAIRFPHENSVLCSDARCRLAVLVSYTLPLLVCSPSFFVFSVRETRIREGREVVVLYHVALSRAARQGDELLYTANFWTYSVVVKLLPCCVLAYLSCWLVSALHSFNRRKHDRARSSEAGAAEPCSADQLQLHKSELRSHRTVRMLVAVLLLFLLTELPQGVLGLLSGALGRCFFHNCYHRFGELMDVLALLNGAVSFLLYCLMSRQFRRAFGQLFRARRRALKWGAVSQTEVHSTYV
ncbi:G-protein coupled receptor dmsr-1-like [Bacillus rossius redtenbacheri]|uniref:G-protein coupled receptor dmsr-1-like n=1 Tax=Bacillus rossius redtenbacheri TaxID=93214 RepID=UPI002FDE92DE